MDETILKIAARNVGLPISAVPKNGDILLNRSDAGHSATKWKVDVDLSLNSVALSPRLSEVDKKSSEEGRPGVIEPLETVEQGSRLPLVTKKSDTSLSSQVVELDISPPGHAFRPSRQFVPSSTNASKSWTEHFSKAVKRTASHSSALQTATSGTASDSSSLLQPTNLKYNEPSSSLILKDSQVPTEYFDYRDIQGGTVIELFHELLRLRKDYSEAGYMEFVRAFLLTYPLFTTSAELISAVKTELKASAADPESGAWAKKRVYQITHIWCEDFKADVVGEVATGLLDILDMELWNSESDLTPYIIPEMVADLKKMVLSAVDENAINYETSISLETESLSYDVNANTVIKGSNYLPSKTPGHTIDVTGLLKDGLTPSLFLHMDPYEFAKQLYLFHKSSYQTYRTRLLNPLCYIPQSLPSTTTPMHLLFTTSSPHFLTSFVNQHILIDSHQIGTDRPHELVTRAMLIEHWIRVGEELLEIGDMCGWCAIAVSICSFAILRLKQSWKFVNQDLVERVRNLWTPVLINSNMFSTDIWIDDWQYYSTRAKLNVLDASLTGITLKDPHAHHFRYPTSNGIPFFGVIRQYVERLRRHVNRYVSSPINTHEQSPPIVNFEKYWSIYDAVWCSLERYQMLQTQDDDHENNLKIEPIGPIQAFFEHTHVNLSSVPNDYNVLQECSLECEPKPLLLGGSIRPQQNWAAFSDSVAPPPSWILSFPQLVSTIKLSDTLTGTFHPSSVRNMKMFQQLPAPRTSRSKKINMPDTIQEMDATVKGDGGHATSTSSIQETGRLARYRKRTYSFPSSRSNSELGIEGGFSAAENMENNSRSWVNAENYRKASVVSKSPFHAISHIGAVGEKLLSVRDGELILQIDIANERKLSCSSFDSLFGYTLQPVALEPINPISKTSVTWTEEQHQVSATDRTIESQNVIVKAGTFERLIDVLIYGLSEYSANVDRQDEFGEYVFSECRLSVDMQEYVHTFFVTYRTFLSATELLEQLRKSFINACSIGRITKLRQKYSLKSMFEPTFDSKNPMDEPDISDWKYIARVRLQILDLIIFWTDEFFWDFVNDSGNRKRTSQFIQQTTKSIEEMRLHIGELMEENGDIDEEAERVTKLLDIIHQKMKYIHDRLLFQFLSPTLEHRAIADLQTSQLDKVDIIEKCSKLTSQAKVEPKTGPNGSVQSPYVSAKPTSPVSSQQLFPKRHLQSVMDQLGPADILQQVDSIVQQVFKDITLQDWILLYDALAAQSVDPYSWLPVRKGLNYSSSNQWMPHPYTDQTAVSNVIDDEVVISDIFIAIQSARRSTGVSTAGTGDNLLSALPEAIQQLFSLHFSVRSWVINELTSFTIDAEHRAERIQKCLDMVVLSRLRMASEPAFKEFINNPDVLDPLSNGGKVIPGFVEYSILSALVSPQVRLFSKAWSKTAEKNQAQNLDTLESIVDSAVTIAQLSQPLSKVTRSRPYVIGLGWIIEMMLQLCEDSTESLRNNEPLVKFDQCRYVYNFLRFITGIQELSRQESGIRMSESGNLTEKLWESLAPRLMDFLTAPTTTWPPMPWKELRDFTNRENVGQDKLKTSSTTSALTQKLSSNASHGAHAIPGLGSKTTVFGKLVSRQQEKLKADIKERDRIDREWRDVQHKMQKKQLEQAKNIEKREKKLLKHQHGSSHQSSHLPWINSFLRGLKLTHTIGDSQESVTGGKDSILQNEILAPPTITDNMKASNVINLINSTSSVASTYLKRDFVFRIVTEEGGQFLFQAINDSEMHDWIRTINNAAKEGAARRLTVLVAEAEIKRRSGTSDDLVFLDDRQRKKGKSVCGSVYGVELSELMGNGKIPLIVEKCIDEIERRGLEEVGIYRVAGSGETVAELRQQLNRNVASVNLSDDAWIDINVVADALKQFFRDLPEPLLTFDRYADFMKASGT